MNHKLTLGQNELWFIHSLEGKASIAYNESVLYSLQGNVNKSALEKAFITLIQKHPLLRTKFILDEEGNVSQCVVDTATMQLQNFYPISHDQLESAIEETISEPFELSHAPLIRAALFSMDANTHLLLIVAHHIVIDGTSFSIIAHDLSTFYNAITDNISPSIGDISMNYFDHVVTQSDLYLSESYHKKVSLLAQELKGTANMNFLATPPAKKQPDVFSGHYYNFSIDSEIQRKISDIAKNLNITSFHFLFAAYCVFLNQYTRNQDFVIGIPFENRQYDRKRETVGYFVNTLPIRIKFDGGLNFTEFTTQIRKTLLSVLGKQHIAFEHIASELQLERKLPGIHPLIQTIFVWGDNKKLELNMNNIQAKIEPHVAGQTSKFDISIFMMENTDGTIGGYFEYRDFLFNQSLIADMASHFKILIENIVENPQKLISNYSMLNEQKKAYMKRKLFTGMLNKPVSESLASLFRQAARTYGDNTALRYKGDSYSYQFVDHQSEQWASYIRYRYKAIYNQELRPNTLIALYVDRSVEMIIAILAILKAGGVYVPIDPAYPPERIKYIVEHSQAAMMLTQTTIDLQDIPISQEKIVLIDDATVLSSTDHVHHNISCQVSPKDAAYVLYTSGSTGNPKGVTVTHENVVCLFRSLEKVYDLTDSDVWSLFHTFCFDISVWEIFGALLFGGKLVIIPYHITRDPKEFHHVVKTEKITILTQTPSAFQVFITEDLKQNGRLEHLRYIAFVGESLKVSILQPWVDKYGTYRPYLVNMYGITETTVYTNYKFIHQTDIDLNRDNIGVPLNEFSMCVLDDKNEWSPIGCAGEICIGGRGLSRGYLYQKNLTDEKFFKDPYSSYLELDDSSLLYRTGDLGRWLSDGSIEYLGRKDFQVKLRGFRIELSEIETVLGSYHDIMHATVLLKGHDYADAHIVAFYTVQNNKKIDTTGLMIHLRSFLPEYMVPKKLVQLESFPINVNGKVDRKLLENINEAPCALDAIETITDQFEYSIAEIWADILKINIGEIGRNSNFFELGGNSLLVINMLTQLNQSLACEFTLPELLASPTIKSISSQLLNKQSNIKTQENELISLIRADSILGEMIQPLQEKNPRKTMPKAIFITGVTGFLGVHMLDSLLTTTESKIYCLVRASNEQSGHQLIIKTLKKYNLDSWRYSDRIVALVGDISKPWLGLSSSQYSMLENDIDSIYHVAALVHHIYDYKTLRKPNVISVRNLLSLATNGQDKAIHFISTLATKYISPLEDTVTSELMHNGYLTSKWTAERLIEEAHARGISAYLYRPGNIVLGQKNCFDPQQNHTLLRLKGMLQLKHAYVRDTETLEMMPVDLLAQAIIDLSKNPTDRVSYNLNNPITISWTQYLQFAQNKGFKLTFLDDTDKWNDFLDGLDEHNALYKFAYLYKIKPGKGGEVEPIEPDYYISTPSYENMISRQLSCLIQQGFIKEPNVTIQHQQV